MRNRILDFSQQGGYLKLHLENLIILQDGLETARIPIEDIAVVVLANPKIVISQSVLAALMKQNVSVVICGPNKMPAGMSMSLWANYIQTERFRHQIEASKPVRKRLWRQVVQVKVRMQGKLLEALHGDDYGLIALAGIVASGDTGNIEARAARKYWANLFKEYDFKRDVNAGDQNRMLNYGYAILRSVVARSLCASGLHLSLGLHHCNRYNPFVLADDIMEPFRPLVDYRVVKCVQENGTKCRLGSQEKEKIIGGILSSYRYQGEERTLFDWLSRVSSSLVAVFEGRGRKLFIPELLAPEKNDTPVGV